MKKGILINVKERVISYVVLEPNQKGSYLPSIYNCIDAERFEVVELNEKNDLFVDEEGLNTMTEETMFFKIDGMMNTPVAGNGLILGLDDMGNSIDTTLSVMDLMEKIHFYTAYEMAFRTRFGLLI